MKNQKIAAHVAECPCTPVSSSSATSQLLTGKEAIAHLELLLSCMASPASATKEQVNAFYQKARGYYCVTTTQSGAIWVAFDNASGEALVEDFKTESAAIQWLDVDSVSMEEMEEGGAA